MSNDWYFLRHHPNLRVDLLMDDQHQDLVSEVQPTLEADGYGLTVTIKAPVSGPHARGPRMTE